MLFKSALTSLTLTGFRKQISLVSWDPEGLAACESSASQSLQAGEEIYYHPLKAAAHGFLSQTGSACEIPVATPRSSAR